MVASRPRYAWAYTPLGRPRACRKTAATNSEERRISGCGNMSQPHKRRQPGGSDIGQAGQAGGHRDEGAASHLAPIPAAAMADGIGLWQPFPDRCRLGGALRMAESAGAHAVHINVGDDVVVPPPLGPPPPH